MQQPLLSAVDTVGHYSNINSQAERVSTFERQVVIGSIRPFNNFPRELLLHILSFYTKNFREIVRFSCLSSACKDAADHSEIWMSKRLSFYAPKYFFVAWQIIPSTYQGSVHEYLVENNLEEIGTITYDLMNNNEPFRFAFLVHLNNQSSDQQLISPETARKAFMQCFIKYQKYWFWIVNYGKYLYLFHSWFDVGSTGVYQYLSVPVVFLLSSLYFVFDLSQPTTLTMIGFCLLFIVLLFYCYIIIGLSVFHVIHRWFYHYYTLDMPERCWSFCEIYSATMISMGLFLPFVLAWFKFSFPGNQVLSIIPWFSLPLLMWGCFFAGSVIWIREIRNIRGSDTVIITILAYLMTTIPLSLLLTGLENHSLGQVGPSWVELIPLYPFFLLIVITAIYRVIYTIVVVKYLFWDISIRESYQSGRLGMYMFLFALYLFGNLCIAMVGSGVCGLALLSFGIDSFNPVVWIIVVLIGFHGFFGCFYFEERHPL